MPRGEVLFSERLRALNRFGLGARSADGNAPSDPRGWLHQQLAGDAPQPERPAGASLADVGKALGDYRRAGQRDPAARMTARRALTAITVGEGVASLNERVTSQRPFVERLVAFWSNHFCIAINARLAVGPLAGHYEREAIRPHVLGKFEEMVLASARHPAMLVYLDNAQSVGPNSMVAQRARGRREPGLNENYARELLELHTLGVDGGYSQRDVTELARLLTGWTAVGLNGEGAIGFRFLAPRHERGTKTVLGVRYRDGEDDGVRAIRALAKHPSTAKFIATKLARHFIADEPPARAVDALAKRFRDTDGDLRAVSAALVDLPEAWDAQYRKFRSPQDWLVAALRSMNAPAAGPPMFNALRQLRQPLWAPASPKGFGDLEREWADSDALLNRAELARTMARRVTGRTTDVRVVASAIELADHDLLPGMLADDSIPRADRLALALAGPAFQWR